MCLPRLSNAFVVCVVSALLALIVVVIRYIADRADCEMRGTAFAERCQR